MSPIVHTALAIKLLGTFARISLARSTDQARKSLKIKYRGRGSNPHGAKLHRILSSARRRSPIGVFPSVSAFSVSSPDTEKYEECSCAAISLRPRTVNFGAGARSCYDCHVRDPWRGQKLHRLTRRRLNRPRFLGSRDAAWTVRSVGRGLPVDDLRAPPRKRLREVGGECEGGLNRLSSLLRPSS